MSDAMITSIATIFTAIIGAITSIIVAKIQFSKKDEAQSQADDKRSWAWISGGIFIGAVTGFLLATFLLRDSDIVLDSMDSTDGWESYVAPNNAGQVVLVEGRDKQAVEIIYYLVPAGYVGIAKILDAPPAEGTTEIILDYRGEGSTNMLEVKVLYPPNAQEKSAVFSYDIWKAIPTNGWSTISVPYTEFKCWPDTGCREDEFVAPSQIWKIDFAVSTKGEGQAGVGTIAIDQIRVR